MNRKAFTLIELIAVVIIIAVIAGFAVPNYRNTVERAHVRDARANLIAVHAAEMIERSETGTFWPNAGAFGVIDINTNLRLNIIEQGMTYQCAGTGATFTCTAIRNPGAAFTLTVDQNPLGAGNPSCVGCP